MPAGRTVSVLCAAALVTCGALAAASEAHAEDPASTFSDTVGPELRRLIVDPTQVDVSAAATTVAVSAELADPSGVSAVSVRLGADAEPVPLHRTGGHATEGIWSGVVTIAQANPSGAVDAHLEALDAAGAYAGHVVAVALLVKDAPPATPAAVAASADVTSPGTLLVAWTPPEPNGGSPVGAYLVSAVPVDAEGTKAASPPAATVDAATLSTSLTGLTVDTRYRVTVAARNIVGTGAAAVADATTELDAVTVADAPTAVELAPGDATLAVTWTTPTSDGGSPVSRYEVTAEPRAPSTPSPPAAVVDAGATAALLSGLTNGVVYDVDVRAVNEVGRSLAARSSGSPRGVPGAPRIGVPTAYDGAAVVRWTAPEDDGGAPVLRYVITATPSGVSVDAPGDARSVTLTGLGNGVASTFRVAAVTLAGSGAPSAASTAVVPRMPARLVVVAQPIARVRFGTATVVDAALRGPADIALADQRVELLAKVVPSKVWRRVAAGTTDGSGRVTLRAALPATAALRLHHPPGVIAAADVHPRSVTVTPRLTAAAGATTVRLGATITVRGAVAPAHPVGSAVWLQRYVSGAWRTIATGRMTSTKSYALRGRPAYAGGYTLRVVKPMHADHGAGASLPWRHLVKRETVVDVAREIVRNRRITLAAVHVGGIRDLAHPRQNGADLAAGRPAHRSSYGNAPGGYTSVDIRVLRAIRAMGARGSVTVSEIVGGDHARGSKHFSGRAVDISWVNGRHVGPGSGFQRAVDACRAHGANVIFSPAYDPYGGHHNHVHCQWG